ncbi:MAG TPA: c-type cytochrome [Vicinamibacterales bacterium]|jgi:thiosulfate dehydrogenase
MRGLLATVLSTVVLAAAACSPAPAPGAPPYKLNGPLIPSRVTMIAAWDVPRNPLTDKTLDDSRLAKEVKWGYRIFTDTPREASRFTGGRISCSNCHMNAGQREKSLPLVGIAGQFPEYNRRAGRFISLEDRIVDCFLRSENGTGHGAAAELPTTGAKEVLAVAAYLAWLSRGSGMGQPPSWRGQNTIPTAAIVPVEKLDLAHGESVFGERCVSCHGQDGQGVFIGDKRAAPLWGPDSWNDGAGAARVYTLAGIIRFTMPYLDPGSLTDLEAQEVAAFINSKARPEYPFKDRDYRTEPLPPDSVYYHRANIASLNH